MTSFRFFRAGGLPQVRIESGAEIGSLLDLDPKLWVALACPTAGLEFDSRTLSLIDTDKDGRIRLPEVLAAIRFSKERLSSLDLLIGGRDGLSAASLASNAAGNALGASLREVLRHLGKPETGAVSVAEATGAADAMSKQPFNGDGILVDASSSDPAIKKVIAEILLTVGGEADRSGVQGVSQAKLDAFFAELVAFETWNTLGHEDATTCPLGDKTGRANAASKAVATKVDDYFARTKLAVFDPRVVGALNRADSDYTPVISKDISAGAQELSGFPLARVEPARPLPLGAGLNPAWDSAMATFVSAAVEPLLGAKSELTFDEWTQLRAKLAPFDAWLGSKPPGRAEALGVDRVREILAGSAKQQLSELITQDLSRAPEYAGLVDLEKAVRFQRDLHTLLRNFASFADFYDPKALAVFQAGTLFVDGRSCDLCVRVADPGKHVALAGLAKCHLVYCDCTRGAEKLSIAALVSDGDSDGLLVGRNGYFVDRKGHDWDAVITRIVDNPISVREAFWSPYKRVLRYIEEQATKKAAESDTAAGSKLSAAVDTTAAATASAKPAERPRFDLGSIALIGVAISGVAALVGTVLSAILGLGYWIPLGLVSILLAISLPSMVVAAMKLRQRNLGPILDAGGWAINGRARINIPFGRALTSLPKYPVASGNDRFADSRPPWKALAVIVSIVYLFIGLWIHDVTPVRQLKERIGFEVSAPQPEAPKTEAPAAQPAK